MNERDRLPGDVPSGVDGVPSDARTQVDERASGQESDPVPELDTSPEIVEPATDAVLVREFARGMYAGVVPELVGGETVAEVLASIDTARAAFERITGRSSGAADPHAGPAANLTVPTVPAGGALPFAIDPDQLPAAEKIRRGLNGRT